MEKIYRNKILYLTDFFSNFKLFCCLDFPFLYIFAKIFDLLIIITFFLIIYHNKYSSIINRFFTIKYFMDLDGWMEKHFSVWKGFIW